VISRAQAYYVGDAEGCRDWLQTFTDAGARHLVVRFASMDAAGQLERAAPLAGL
jgi:hypothetical protein